MESQRPAMDYDRACDVGDLVGLIPVGGGIALVLGDEPLSTTWVPARAAQGGYLVGWEYAESDAAVVQHLGRLDEASGWAAAGLFSAGAEDLILFDAADPGLDPSSARLAIALPAGSDRITTARWWPDERTSLLLHHFAVA